MKKGMLVVGAVGAVVACSSGGGADLMGDVMRDAGDVLVDMGEVMQEVGNEVADSGTVHADDHATAGGSDVPRPVFVLSDADGEAVEAVVVPDCGAGGCDSSMLAVADHPCVNVSFLGSVSVRAKFSLLTGQPGGECGGPASAGADALLSNPPYSLSIQY